MLVAASTEQVLAYYYKRSASASAQGTALVFAIPLGMKPESVGICIEITRTAMTCENAFNSSMLDIFSGTHNLKFTPLMEALDVGTDENFLSNQDRMLRSGYARDRVIAAGKIKHAMMAVECLEATNELRARHRLIPNQLKSWFAKFEKSMNDSGTTLQTPSVISLMKRNQWSNTQQVDNDALHRQLTLLQATPIVGNTLSEVEALAADPNVARDATIDVARNAIETQHARDRFLGTEMFVAFSFASRDHRAVVAAGGSEGGLAIENGERAFPAMVTLHAPDGTTGALVCPSSDSPNVMTIGDAAVLMAKVHALSRECGRDATLLEHACV